MEENRGSNDAEGSSEVGSDIFDPGWEATGSGDDGETSPAFEAKLHRGGEEFGRSDSTLLRAVDETGSLTEAASALGRSYSHAHRRVAALERAFGQLVESRRGGADGGGTVLTPRADRLLTRFDRLRTEFTGVAEVTETVFEGQVVDRTGSVVLVETAAGRLHAVATGEEDAVHVTVRADTVTLHRSDSERAVAEVSARNQLNGTVVGVAREDGLARIRIDVGASRPLTALLTVESARQLSLAEDTGVVASFKTTATRVTPKV